jgi:glyoxylase-like metal-dependent hydrolase (beta-lactamase superfamily II)
MGTDSTAGRARPIAEGVYWLPVGGCNVYMVGSAAQWALIDTGWTKAAEPIRKAAESLFGRDSRPAAILITHAHPDHTGSAAELARRWGAPVYVHRDDLPYVLGGVLPEDLLDPVGRVFNLITRALPRRTVERMTRSPLKDIVQTLPGPEAEVPGLLGWECIHAPGHSPGHVVFFRRNDRVLIAGDAVLTAPLIGMLPAMQRISRPAWFVSWDWELTKAAFTTVAELEPRVLATGHGTPMTGDKVAGELRDFASRFRRP